jgi:hypothetical protein
VDGSGNSASIIQEAGKAGQGFCTSVENEQHFKSAISRLSHLDRSAHEAELIRDSILSAVMQGAACRPKTSKTLEKNRHF